MSDPLLEQLQQIGACRRRTEQTAHKPTQEQVVLAFKEARDTLYRLNKLLLRYPSAAASQGLDNVQDLIERLHEIQRDLGMHEEVTDEIEEARRSLQDAGKAMYEAQTRLAAADDESG